VLLNKSFIKSGKDFVNYFEDLVLLKEELSIEQFGMVFRLGDEKKYFMKIVVKKGEEVSF